MSGKTLVPGQDAKRQSNSILMSKMISYQQQILAQRGYYETVSWHPNHKNKIKYILGSGIGC